MNGAMRYPDFYADGSFIYRLDDRGNSVECIAWAKNAFVARKALEALRTEYPDQKFEQRRRAHVESE